MSKHLNTEFHCKDCDDKSCAVAALNDTELELLNENCTKVEFKKGEIIFKQGTPITHIVYIKSGFVKEHMTGPNNKEQILKIVKSPAYLRISSKLGSNINQYSATAIKDTIACFIDIDIFKKIIYMNSKFAYEILTSVCEDGLYCFNKFVNQTQKQIHGRLAEAILYFSKTIYNNSKEFVLPISRKELANLIGSTRESVARTLIQFKNDGIININEKKITITNPKLLEKISERG